MFITTLDARYSKELTKTLNEWRFQGCKFRTHFNGNRTVTITFSEVPPHLQHKFKQHYKSVPHWVNQMDKSQCLVDSINQAIAASSTGGCLNYNQLQALADQALASY